MALVRDGQITWSDSYLENSGSLAAMTRLFLSANVRAVDLTGIAVSIGPGSFTGIKVGLAFVYGLVASRTAGRPLPIFGASALAAAAQELRKRRSLESLGLLLPATRSHGFLAIAGEQSVQCLVNTAPQGEPHELTATVAARLKACPAGMPLFVSGTWPQMSEALKKLGKTVEAIDVRDICSWGLEGLSHIAWTAFPEHYSQRLPSPQYLRLSTAEEALAAASQISNMSSSSKARE